MTGTNNLAPMCFLSPPGRHAAVMVDIDGTLSDSRPLRPYVLSGNWDAFHYHAGHADPNPSVVDLVNLWAEAGYRILIATARPVAEADGTRAWLHRHMVPFDAVLSRPAGDYRPAHTLKRAMWHYIESTAGLCVVGAIDDRPTCVATYHMSGIPTVLGVSGWHDPEPLHLPVVVSTFYSDDQLPHEWTHDGTLKTL